MVIDVAMTETARLAHYVLPAASQFEKPEATFFNLEFPHNTFHLRHPLLEPLPGTLPEPEIWARLVRALGVVDDDDLRPLRRAAAEGLGAYAVAFMTAVGANPALGRVLPYVLYETLGPTMPDGLAGAAALWGLAQKTAMAYPDAVRRAGHADGNALFEAILASRSGLTFTVHEYVDDFALITHEDRKISLEIPEMVMEARALTEDRAQLTSTEFPMVLSAGERRAYTANDILRDPSWRKRDADGALRISVADAAAIGVGDGDRVRITTAAGCADATVEVSDRDAAGPRVIAQRFRGRPRRGRRAGRRARGRPQRIDLVGVARCVRRDTVAQARACAGRTRPRRGRRDLSVRAVSPAGAAPRVASPVGGCGRDGRRQ